jgi:hypothetical protein
LAPGDSGGSYIISWFLGHPTIGTPPEKVPDTSHVTGYVEISKSATGAAHVAPLLLFPHRFPSEVTVYLRKYEAEHARDFSYLSPHIHHARVTGLEPGKTYFYRVGNETSRSSLFNFTTLPSVNYPFKFGLVADLGQSTNSSDTVDQLLASSLHALLNVGDLAYADRYSLDNPEPESELVSFGGTNQQRWDSFAVLTEPLLAHIPAVHSAGNHEIEQEMINTALDSNTEHFGYPHNYPFQVRRSF